MKNWVIALLAIAVVALSVRGVSAGKSEESGEDAANPAIENIMTRSSVRSYTSQSIGKDTVEMIICAGMAAPTAADKRPWAFVAVTDKSVRDTLSKRLPYAKMAAQAPLLIAVCGNKGRALPGEGADFWVQDCSAATENVLLAAHALGLGAVWTGVYPLSDREQAVREVLALPDSIVPLSLVCIGHPAVPQTPKDKWNPADLHYNRY